MISIVSVYNNKNFLDQILIPSIRNQTVEYEFIPIDNTSGKFKSAAAALNFGAKQAHGEYIMFVHQDVELDSPSWFEEAEGILNGISNLGIAGVAGMSENGCNNKARGRNIIKHGNPVEIWPWGNQISEPTIVQTVDECLLIIPKSVFAKLQFDEDTCDDWHLYGVDYCLSCKSMGLNAFVIPLSIWHESKGGLIQSKLRTLKSLGSLPKPYYQTLTQLIKKHKHEYKHIYTTCDDFSTSRPLIFQRVESLTKKGLKLILEKLKN